ncbi:uncharacterized protein GJ701_015907 [Geothlypis trichas]
MYKREPRPRLGTRTSSLQPQRSCSACLASLLAGPTMTFCYQRQCEDSCWSPCGYGTVCSSRSYDCGSPCGSQGYYGRLCGYREYCPSFSARYCSPYSSRYFQRCSYGSCYPCYQC